MPVTNVRSKWSSGSLVFENSSGTELMTISSTGVNIPTFSIDAIVLDAGATLDLNGVADSFILDADADTVIDSPTDDQIDIKISGADDFQFTANTFTALSGSTIATNTIAETTGGSGVTIDGVLIKDGGLTIADASNIILNTTTGTKIGTAATQKLGFFNATPVVQQTKAGHNNWAAVSDVVAALVNLGLFDQS